MDVSDLKAMQLVRKAFPIELRVCARTRHMPDIDEKLNLRGAKEIHELGGGPRRMPDREKAQRHTKDQEPVRKSPLYRVQTRSSKSVRRTMRPGGSSVT